MSIPVKPRKLLFHIGHHKTGSTSIQNAFATKRVTLENGRILYPASLAHNYLPAHFATYLSKGVAMPGSPGRPGLAKIAERLQAGDFDVAVISGEEFESSDPEGVSKVMGEFMLPHVTDHAVICYVRPHAARILSSFAEQVKLGLFSLPVEAFFEKAVLNRRFQYEENLARWSEVFKDRFLLRPLIRSELAGGSVLQDFIATGFGPDAPVRIGNEVQANESLCLEDLLLAKLVQDQLASRDRKLRHGLGWEMSSGLSAAKRTGKSGTKLMLHKALAERIRAAYLADAEAMDARFFAVRPVMRAELDRAVDEALPTAQSFEPSDYFNAETLRTVTVLAAQINRLLDHGSESWPMFLHNLRLAELHGKGDGQAETSQGQPRKPVQNKQKSALRKKPRATNSLRD